MTTPRKDERIARMNLASSRCTMVASIFNFARVALLCWMGSFVAPSAQEIDSHAPKVVATATVPAQARDVA